MSLDSTSRAGDSDAAHALLARHLNRRQASKILDAHSQTALVIHRGQCPIYVRGLDGDLFAVRLNQHRALCFARWIDARQLGLWLADADPDGSGGEIDVEQHPRSEYVTDPQVGDRR